MEEPHLEDFDPKKFVKGLSAPQLEMMAEFYEEAEANLRLLARAGKSFKAPTGQDMLEVFKAAEPELLGRFAEPDTEERNEFPHWRNAVEELEDEDDEPAQQRLPKDADSEWLRELGAEIQKRRTGLTLPRVPTPEEIRALLEVTKNNSRDHLVIRVLYATGIRREELTNLRVADLFFERNIVFIRQGKWDKDRYVLVDPETSRLLADFTRNFLLTDQVFDISTRTVNRIVNRAAKKTGLRERFAAIGRQFTVHSLRHSFATHMYESGADLFVLKTLLGHLSLRVTRTYVHVGVQTFCDRYSSHHPFANNPALFDID